MFTESTKNVKEKKYNQWNNKMDEVKIGQTPGDRVREDFIYCDHDGVRQWSGERV